MGCPEKPRRFSLDSKQLLPEDARQDRHTDGVLYDFEVRIKLQAKHHNPVANHLLQSIPGNDLVLDLVDRYEIGDIGRLPNGGDYLYPCPTRRMCA